jgi:tetratricopeptide (TPR) repeat protein
MTVTIRISLVALLAVTACRSSRAPAPSPHAQRTAPVPHSGPGATPRSRAEFPTTSGAIALGNLDSQIEVAEKALGPAGKDVGTKTTLASLLLMRGQLLGRLADYERADRLTAEVVAAQPKLAGAHQVRASAASTLHLFSLAASELDRAQALGANPRSLEGPRAGLLEATGRGKDALPVRRRQAEELPDLATLTSLAVLEAELGDPAAASRLFVRAQDDYHGASPFPLAFLYLQEGLVAERAGQLTRARDLFEAAVERVPPFAPAVSHLAGALASMGQRQRAIAVLEPVLKSSDDPELVGQLAALLRAEGRDAEADALFVRADQRYQELLARTPEAFGDHAARFYLSWGGHADRALALARANLASRPTREAFALAITAGIAAGDPAYACTVADRLKASSAFTPLAHIDAARAFAACGRKDEAQTLLTQAEQALAPSP